MKKKLHKILWATGLLLSTTILSCNKESIIEGVIPEPASGEQPVMIGKKVSLTNKTGVPIEIGFINIAGDKYKLSLSSSYFSGISSVYFNPTDSIRINYFSITGIQSNTVCYLKYDYNSLSRFKYGDSIINYFSSAGVGAFTLLVASTRIYPYVNPYTSQDSAFMLGSNYYEPTFSLKQNNGYLAFKIEKNGTKIINYYGWIHLTIGQDSVSFDNYKYKKEERPIIGK